MRQFLLLALVAAVLAAPAPSQGGIKVPLQDRSLANDDGSVDMEALLTSLNGTLVKYGNTPLPPLPSSGSQKRANLPLTDQVQGGEDSLYYGPITIGAAKQRFTIDFDTGSADLFVPGPSCGSAQGCTGKTKYNQKGHDQNKMTSVTYGSGKISGEDYKDTVTVAGLTVANQGFISLKNAAGFSSSKSDGLMGMGFSTIAQTGFPTFFENLISAGKVSNKEFSFYLGRSKSKTQGRSELTLGGSDSSRFTGKPKSVAVTQKGYWQVAVDGVSVRGKPVGASTKGQAAIDTGTTIIIAPTAAASAIFAKIPGSIPVPLSSNGIQLYAFPCGTTAIPAITFAGKNFAINKLDFNLGSLGPAALETLRSMGVQSPVLDNNSDAGSLCVAGIGGGDIKKGEALYVVGDVFLKNWYSIFSYNGGGSVSFAPAKGNQ